MSNPRNDSSSLPTSMNNGSLLSLLSQSARLYLKHWPSFTRVLIWPVAQIMLGIYACICMSHGLTHWFIENPIPFLAEQLWLVILLLLAIPLLTLTLFFKGFWEYMIYWASLNLNAQTVLIGEKPDFKAAYQAIAKEKSQFYIRVLLAYCLLPIPFLLLSILGPILAVLISGLGPMVSLGVLIFSGLLGLALLVALIITLVLLSLLFQVVAFEPPQTNPFVSLWRSAQLVKRKFWTALGLQLFLMIATHYVVAGLLALLLQAIGLAAPLNGLHEWLIHLISSGIENTTDTLPPLTAMLLPQMQEQSPETAVSISTSVLMVIFTALLLPWGTFAFTLLYQHLTEEKPAPESNPTQS